MYEEAEQGNSVWAIFSDLMAATVGVFVLMLIWAVTLQLELTQSLEQEIARAEAEQQRRIALEKALADPLASGRVTFKDGRIGINGSVLFALNSDRLQKNGRALLNSLVIPLQYYLDEHDEMLMVSGFTDDLPIQEGNLYADNWGLSAQRALTVTRTLIEQGMPADRVFAAAFGQHQPVASNSDADGRAQNRRVEITTVPRNPRAAETNTVEPDDES